MAEVALLGQRLSVWAVVSIFEPEFAKGASASVLRCLQARYAVDTFYTNAGCTLVALNPFKPVPQLYSPALMREYHTAPQPQVRLSHFLGLRAPPYPSGPPSSFPVIIHLFTCRAVIRICRCHGPAHQAIEEFWTHDSRCKVRDK